MLCSFCIIFLHLLLRLLVFQLLNDPVLRYDFPEDVSTRQDHLVCEIRENTFFLSHHFYRHSKDFETLCEIFPSVFRSKHDHMSKNQKETK